MQNDAGVWGAGAGGGGDAIKISAHMSLHKCWHHPDQEPHLLLLHLEKACLCKQYTTKVVHVKETVLVRGGWTLLAGYENQM